MTARSAEQPIQYEPEEVCPPTIALTVGLQGAVLVLAPTVLNVVIAFRAAGLDDTYLTWGVFAAMVICAVITGLQAFQFRRFGAGHIVLAWPAAMFIAIMVSAVSAGGPETFASLLVICSLVQIALAWWLPTLRRIVTPVVSGTVTMLIAVSVLPIAFDSVQDLPSDASVSAGPVIAVATLLGPVHSNRDMWQSWGTVWRPGQWDHATDRRTVGADRAVHADSARQLQAALATGA